MEITFRDHVTATLLDVDGDERRIARRARVSTQRDGEQHEGLVRSLARERHAVPFEHATMAWEIHVPIFVMREFVRHRMCSISEMSGRYIELEPIFYYPRATRHLQKEQGSKQMEYRTVPGSLDQIDLVQVQVRAHSMDSWDRYQTMLDAGILKEVARLVLPVNIFTRAQVTMNIRALTNFLALRIRHPQSHVESKPMKEIEDLALLMEHDFAENFPVTFSEWNANGRMPL